MSRDYFIFGESLVRVKGGAHMSGGAIAQRSDLGLAAEQIRITVPIHHRHINTDQFRDVPAELLSRLSEATIDMTLVHYDDGVLSVCLDQAVGSPLDGRGAFDALNTRIMWAGKSDRAMGSHLPMFASGNCWVSLNIVAPQPKAPGANVGVSGDVDLQGWRFRKCVLTQDPLVYPVGAEKSMVRLRWRAYPLWNGSYLSGYNVYYPGALNSSGAVLYDNQLDTE